MPGGDHDSWLLTHSSTCRDLWGKKTKRLYKRDEVAKLATRHLFHRGLIMKNKYYSYLYSVQNYYSCHHWLAHHQPRRAADSSHRSTSLVYNLFGKKRRNFYWCHLYRNTHLLVSAGNFLNCSTKYYYARTTISISQQLSCKIVSDFQIWSNTQLE